MSKEVVATPAGNKVPSQIFTISEDAYVSGEKGTYTSYCCVEKAPPLVRQLLEIEGVNYICIDLREITVGMECLPMWTKDKIQKAKSAIVENLMCSKKKKANTIN